MHGAAIQIWTSLVRRKAERGITWEAVLVSLSWKGLCDLGTHFTAVMHMHRPFAWKGGVYLSHWLSMPPSQDKVALAKLDLEHNSLSFVYRFDTLEDELAKLKGIRARTHERSTSTLEQV